MTQTPTSSHSTHDTWRVRQNAGSAAIAAVLMLYFGYGYLAKPTGTSLFDQAGLVFYYTLRLGGLAMAVIAIWSWLGRRSVLIVDAVVSVVIGGLLILTGVLMLVDGGGTLQTVLNVIFGAMFISSGLRNGRDYYLLAVPLDRSQPPSDGGWQAVPASHESDVAPPSPGASLASQLRQRMAQPGQAASGSPEPAAPAPPTAQSEPTLASAIPTLDPMPAADDDPYAEYLQPPSPSEPSAVSPTSPAGADQADTDRKREAPADPPPEGFLAAFAEEDPPQDQ